MTKVKYYPDEYVMEITDHAGFGKVGTDIVCAGASMLMSTLVNAVTDDPDFNAQIYFNNNETLVRVRCYPEEEAKEKLQAVFRTIMLGYEALKQHYPEYIQVTGGSDGY